jgi:chromatin remodeling complex protein RSC6
MATSKKSAGKSSAKKAAPAKKAAAKSSAKSAGKSSAKTAAKGAAKGASKSAGKSAAKGAGRAPNAAFMKPMQPSAELGAVVGTQPQPRSEITKRVWDYIKKNGLQDQTNKRQINADDKLRPVFGGKKNVTMFEMTSLVNKHLKEA